MLKDDDWKLALEDARFRHNALMQLLYINDGQAVTLLRLYLTMTIAAAGAAASIFLGTWALPREFAWALSSAALLLIISAGCCSLATMGRGVNLPGRGAEFWLWAAREEVDREEAFRTYLTNLKEKHEVNRRRNERQANALLAGKIGGLLVVPIAFAVGGYCHLTQQGWPVSQ